MHAYDIQDYRDADGCTFRAEYHDDTAHPPPWAEPAYSGTPLVSAWTNRTKRAGETVLCVSHGQRRYYDLSAATRRARADNWGNWQGGSTPHERGQRLQDAVMADYARMRDWCNDLWHYMGIVAFPLTADGDELRSKSHSIWGIESNSAPAYLQQQTEWLLAGIGAKGRLQALEVAA